MKRILFASATLALCAATTTITVQPGDTVLITAPAMVMHGGIAVNPTFPTPYAGKGTDLLIAGASPKPSGDGSGDFRTVCLRSHFSFDDPIVYPGKPGAAHAHVFFGNTGANAASTAASIASTGNSTCRGGTINRTAYWAPAMVDTATGNVIDAVAMIAYYKTGYQILDNSLFKPLPVGLRMIAGNSAATTEQTWGPASFKCNAGNGPAVYTMPACAPGDQMWQLVTFPQCWDGVNLDSADHKSHMAYPSFAGGGKWFCDAAHPVVVPQITVIVQYNVPAGGMQSWRLSSDMYAGPAGYSLHSDWMMGWKPDIAQTWTTRCLNAGNDCQAHMLGDGREMLAFDGN